MQSNSVAPSRVLRFPIERRLTGVDRFLHDLVHGTGDDLGPSAA